MKTYTKEEISARIQSDTRWLYRGILAIWNQQTADEQTSKVTKYVNKRGFSGIDSRFLSSLAVQIKYRGNLSPKQITCARKCMAKYAEQLTKIANGTL
jgi:hypothetical protein